jgi:hypothetical protein
VVRPERVVFSMSDPLATTVYGASQLIAMRNVALLLGWSLQGNQDAAPDGWLATMTPSASSSQPSSPHGLFTGCGAPP